MQLHAYVYISVMSVYLVFCVLVKQYNYERLNLWQLLLTVSLLSVSIASHLAYVMGSSASWYLTVGVAAESGVLAVLGVLLQTCFPRYASKLLRDESIDLRDLFLFSFLSGRGANARLEQFYAVNSMKGRTEAALQDDSVVLEFPNSPSVRDLQ